MRSNLKAFLAVLALCALVTTFSLRETPKGTLALPAPKHQVVLVGFGGPEQPDLVPIADFIESHTGQRPRIGPDVDFSLAQMDYCLDRDRHQWDADKMVELIDVPEGAVAIAVFNDSLYTSGIPQWRYCFGLKRGHRGGLKSRRRGRLWRRLCRRLQSGRTRRLEGRQHGRLNGRQRRRVPRRQQRRP